MGTIVQEYGPIYGESVNGTVQGRPNGSVYVPDSNTIVLTVPDDLHYITPAPGRYWICDSSANIPADKGFAAVAVSQDLSSYIEFQIFDDDQLTNMFCRRVMTAGLFNWPVVRAIDSTEATEETTVYIRAQLINNNTAIATSDVVTLEVVTP